MPWSASEARSTCNAELENLRAFRLEGLMVKGSGFQALRTLNPKP